MRKGKKTQNSEVVVTAEVSSFASARDKNPILVMFLTMMRRDCAIDLHTYRMMIGGGSSTFGDQFQQLLSQPKGTSSSTSASSGASTSVSSTSVASTSVASTYVDEIYTQVMGPERHGRVRGYGFGPTPTSIFGSTSRRRSELFFNTT
ncbi:hypothetical protein AAG906_038482 [Vitis piasezkii]